MTGAATERSEGFTGFPDSGLATAVPNLFFSRVMPEISDPAELVVSAYFFFAAQLHKRRPHYVSREELAADRTLIRALANLTGKSAAASGADHGALSRGLDLAVKRGTLIRALSGETSDGSAGDVYAVNNPSNYRALESLPEVRLREPLPPAPGEAAPNIFALYEENIGSITPLIAEELKDAEQRYPAQWLREAVREAVELNKRSWRYVASILRRWETEGPSYEKSERDPQIEWLERRFREGKKRPSGSRS
ncbi:MAG: DnaD domain protein [Chloroflexi bacterium]|nr:DnaD domain protein [Chloroflexota bacterium]